MTHQKVIIDTDPGVDDMLAMLLLLKAPTVDVRAITTVAGNTTIQNVTNNAQKILQLAKRSDVPLYSGASQPLKRPLTTASVHGSTGLDGIEVSEIAEINGLAVDKILEIVKSNPNDVILVIIGPQTNIAQAIINDPETMKLAKQFVIMGGAFDVPGNQNGVAEFNIAVDPDAAAIVAQFPVPKVYIPLDLCNQIQVPLFEFRRIQDQRLRESVISAVTPYVRSINKNELKTRGALMYDVLASYYLINPDAFDTRQDNVIVDIENGATYCNNQLGESRMSRYGREATITTNIPYPVFIDGFFGMLS